MKQCLLLLLLLAMPERTLAASATEAAQEKANQLEHAGILDREVNAVIANALDQNASLGASFDSLLGIVLDAENSGGLNNLGDLKNYVATTGLSGQGQQNAVTLARIILGADDAGNFNRVSAGNVARNIKTVTEANGYTVIDAAMQTVGATMDNLDARMDSVIAERGRLREKFGSDSAMASGRMNADRLHRFWVGGFGVWQDRDAEKGRDGYAYNAGGVILGYDHAFGPYNFGLSVNYSRGDLSVDGVSDDNVIDNYGVAAYGTYYHYSGGFLTMAGGYTYSANDMETRMAGLSGVYTKEFNTDSFWTGGSVGYDLRKNGLKATPSIGLRYQYVRGAAHVAKYNGSPLSAVEAAKNRAWTMPINLRLSHTSRIAAETAFTFTVNGGYMYNFTNEGAGTALTYIGLGQPAVRVEGMKPGRHSWQVGTGVKLQHKNVALSVDYRFDTRKKESAHTVTSGIGLTF